MVFVSVVQFIFNKKEIAEWEGMVSRKKAGQISKTPQSVGGRAGGQEEGEGERETTDRLVGGKRPTIEHIPLMSPHPSKSQATLQRHSWDATATPRERDTRKQLFQAGAHE